MLAAFLLRNGLKTAQKNPDPGSRFSRNPEKSIFLPFLLIYSKYFLAKIFEFIPWKCGNYKVEILRIQKHIVFWGGRAEPLPKAASNTYSNTFLYFIFFQCSRQNAALADSTNMIIINGRFAWKLVPHMLLIEGLAVGRRLPCWLKNIWLILTKSLLSADNTMLRWDGTDFLPTYEFKFASFNSCI